MLDNQIHYAKVAHRHEERNSSSKIVPNPFGGVNTHLWRNEAYIVGIVPQPTLFYTLPRQARRPEDPELSGVVSVKSKIKLPIFPRNLIWVWALGLLHLTILYS